MILEQVTSPIPLAELIAQHQFADSNQCQQWLKAYKVALNQKLAILRDKFDWYKAEPYFARTNTIVRLPTDQRQFWIPLRYNTRFGEVMCPGYIHNSHHHVVDKINKIVGDIYRLGYRIVEIESELGRLGDQKKTNNASS